MKVTLDEDGSEIEVPSVQKPIYSDQISGPRRVVRTVDVPLPHADYEFLATVGRRYLAVRKD